MVRIKELKAQKVDLLKKTRQLRKDIKALIAEGETAANDDTLPIVEKIEAKNIYLNQSLARIDNIADEIKFIREKSKPKKTKPKHKPKKKKVKKVHNVAGRHVDPTGFSGVVQGGSPGGGKRR